MRHRLAFHLAPALFLAIALLPAQQVKGSLFQTTSSVASRGALQSARGELITRFDRDDYRGFCSDPAAPGMYSITGYAFTVTDSDGSTPETYTVKFYAESTTQPGFPDIANALLALGPFTLPATPVGPATFNISSGFGPPLLVPASGDLFVGIQLLAAPLWPLDGLAVNAILGAPSSRWPTFDRAGSAPIQNNGYGLTYNPLLGSLIYPSSRQLMIDVLGISPGGSCTAITNQIAYPISNAAPGTGSFFSGLHPDARSPSINPGRADNVAFNYLDSTMPNGMAVFFLAAIGGFGPELPLAGFVPGSVGVACLPAAATVTLGIQFLNGGVATNVIVIPATARATIAGLPLVQQAIGLVPAPFSLRGSPCGKQVF
jgi:hypothetical protein